MVEVKSNSVAEKPAPKAGVSYDEFLAWCDEDTWAEWVDGEVVMVSLVSARHQLIKKFLVGVLDTYTQKNELGIVLDAPFQMKLGPDLPGREPDVLFVAREHLGRLKETYLDGAADLVIEIVSPESGARDRGDKFYEYERAGVGEYWLIDPVRQVAEFYRLSAEQRYGLIYPDTAGAYHSQVLAGFWLKVDWLWQEPLRSPLRAVAEIAGVDPAQVDAFERALRGK